MDECDDPISQTERWGFVLLEKLKREAVKIITIREELC